MPSKPEEITLLLKQEILVLVIILFATRIDTLQITQDTHGYTQDYVREPDTARKIPKLVAQIRRQLMKDNYDYLPSEEDPLHTDRTEDPLHTDRAEDALHTDRAEDALHTDRAEVALHTDRAEDALHTDRAEDALHTDRAEQDARTEAVGEWEHGRGRDDVRPQLSTTTNNDDFMIPTMRDSSINKDKKKEKPADLGFIMSRKDLLYYIDDKRMMRPGHMRDNDVNNTSEGLDVEFDDIVDATKPDAKYKMIEVKEGEPTRRKSPYRRFIQESNREGYSIIRLDDQPFPEFQLPRARRQYMGGSDSVDGPLPDDASDDQQLGVAF